eukprot:9450170-Alexandrium_andersonii.AAC.1
MPSGPWELRAVRWLWKSPGSTSKFEDIGRIRSTGFRSAGDASVIPAYAARFACPSATASA